MKHKVKHYTDDFKLRVVQEYLNTSKSQKEILKLHGIGGKNNITKWMRTFGLSEPNEEQIQIHSIMSKEKDKSRQEKELELKVHNLEKVLEHEKLKTLALNKMIDIAESKLNIPIRKKPGTKQ